MKVKVLKPFKMNKVGSVIEVNDKLANLMMLLGKCEEYVAPPPAPKRRVTKKKVTARQSTYSTKVMTADEPTSED